MRDTPTAQSGSSDVHGWQPIETAPRDETPILLYIPVNRPDRRILTCSYCEIEWAICGGAVLLGKPTHWQHLPEPPK